jgi:predicted Zn-dependent protease
LDWIGSSSRRIFSALPSIYGHQHQHEAAAEIANGLASLSFSRGDESEADEYSVIYHGDIHYASNGAAAFFQKRIDSGQSGGTSAFLSTHPSPDMSVEDINPKAASDRNPREAFRM